MQRMHGVLIGGAHLGFNLAHSGGAIDGEERVFSCQALWM